MNDNSNPDTQHDTTEDAASANATASGCIWRKISELGFAGAQSQSIMARVSQFGCNKFGFTPYEWQVQTSTAVILGYDVACVARTGDGKSAVFQLLSSDPKTTQIVISPLIGLIAEQVSSLSQYNDL